jgi:hypothetical protein
MAKKVAKKKSKVTKKKKGVARKTRRAPPRKKVAKKPSALSRFGLDSAPWTLGEGEYEGRPTIVRYRRALERFAGEPGLPTRLVVTWEFSPDARGLPDDREGDRMLELEERLLDALEPDRSAVLAFAFTHDGRHEWHFYAGDLPAVEDRMNAALADLPSMPIEVVAYEDPEWDEYRAVLESSS